MPGMDGLETLSELVDWPGSRVLLTGQADEQVAVRAFNRGLIEQFIAKQAPDISRQLIDAVEHLLATPNARHAQTWRVTLGPEQNALLRMPSVGRELASLASRQWIEHVVIGDPFGVLGVDAAGRVSWLQLETPGRAERPGRTGRARRRAAIETGRYPARRASSPISSCGSRLACVGPPELAKAFPVGPERALVGALFPVESPLCPDPGNSYNSWLARQRSRHVQD